MRRAELSGPAAGDRDRAARVPDAVVARDVRARAVQAVGDLPGAGAARAASSACVGYLICSRYDTVWHVMNIAVDADHQRRGHRLGAARGAVRARRRRRRALHAGGAPLQRGRDPPVRARGLPRGRACAGATTRTTARTRSSCGARRRRSQGSLDDVPNPRPVGRYDDPRAGDELRRHLRGGRRRGRARCCSNVISSQEVHERFGGVVPGDRLAPPPRAGQRGRRARRSRAAGATLDDVELVAATQGPGLVGALLVGFSRGQGARRRARAAVRAGRPSAGARRRELPAAPGRQAGRSSRRSCA